MRDFMEGAKAGVIGGLYFTGIIVTVWLVMYIPILIAVGLGWVIDMM